MAMADPDGGVLRRLLPPRLVALVERLRSGLWFVPAVFVVGAVALSVVMNRIDRAVGVEESGSLAFGGDATSAQDLLSTIASSTLTLAGLVFSITIVALVLSSGQFSPRVLRTFLRDQGNQVSLGTFLATFVYALLVLRTVRIGEGNQDAFVPGLSITLAIVAALASLGTFVYFVNHIAQSLRVVSIIESLAQETRACIDRNLPVRREGDGGQEPSDTIEVCRPPRSVVDNPAPGVLVGFDDQRLVALAHRHDCLLRMVPMVGDHVPAGAPMFEVHGDAEVEPHRLLGLVTFSSERTMSRDVAFGFRQLADIAEKALSPSINDPTTAVQVIDRLHDLLRRLPGRSWPTGHHVDEDGGLRLVGPVVGWDGYVSLAFDEIRSYGADSLQITRRLQAVFDDLATVAAPPQQGALDRQRRLLRAAVERSFADVEERHHAGLPDGQGLGRV